MIITEHHYLYTQLDDSNKKLALNVKHSRVRIYYYECR